MNVGYVHTLETPANSIDKGELRVSVIDKRTNRPIEGARVKISYTADPESSIEEVTTNNSGETESVTLPTPPIEYSMEPGINQPYAEYTVAVEAENYEPMVIAGTNVLSGELSLQNVPIQLNLPSAQPGNIVIPAHTLYGIYPPKIPESEIKPVNQPGEIVLSRVVVPEIVVVHDGSPDDPTATDYYVPYRDYVKNVASSEIYSTWPRQTIEANIYAIMSFTLNRVYTEW